MWTYTPTMQRERILESYIQIIEHQHILYSPTEQSLSFMQWSVSAAIDRALSTLRTVRSKGVM